MYPQSVSDRQRNQFLDVQLPLAKQVIIYEHFHYSQLKQLSCHIRTRTSPRLVNWTYHIPSYTWLFPREPRTLYSHVELYLHTCNAKWAVFQLYHCENKLRLIRWWWHLLCTRRTSKHVAPLRHIIQTQASRCFLLLLNDACLAGKQSIQIWYALVWPGWAPTGKHANHYTTNEKVTILNYWLAD